MEQCVWMTWNMLINHARSFSYNITTDERTATCLLGYFFHLRHRHPAYNCLFYFIQGLESSKQKSSFPLSGGVSYKHTRSEIFFRSLANNQLSKHAHIRGLTQSWSKFMKQYQEIKQNWIRRENLDICFHRPVVPKFYNWKGDWVTDSAFTHFWDLSTIFEFTKTQSLKLFSNWWGNSCTMHFVHDAMHQFTCAK